MKTTIGVYNTHGEALDAIRELKKNGFPGDKLSLIGKAEMIDKHLHLKPSQAAEGAEVSIGVVTGSVLGILTGVGIFAIPGLGFLFGAGALVGAFAGFDVGLMGGGIVAILTSVLQLESSEAAKHEADINAGKFLVIAQGNDTELKQAKEALQVPNRAEAASAN